MRRDLQGIRGLSKGSPNDHIFRRGGVEIGRCGLRILSNNEERWSWTIYIGGHITSILTAVPTAGYAASFEEAKQSFLKNFEAMVAAGVVKLPSSDGSTG
jgi:hypothetical protein